MGEQNLEEFKQEDQSQAEQHDEDQNHEEIHQEERRHEDRFTDFMFGQRRGHHQRIEPQQEINPNQNYIDYEQLMFHIDSLIESTKNLKPLFQKFQPYVEQIWKKK
jgi:hypothetical protein